MALTTARAFDEFASRIKLTEAQEKIVGGRKNSAHGYLEDAFDGSNMPLLRSSSGRPVDRR